MNEILKRAIKTVVGRLGYEITRPRSVDDNLDALAQQKRLVKRSSPVILDVGAYVGETVKAYVENFPDAEIHAFEPFPDSYAKLVTNTSDFAQVIPHQMGLADVTQVLELNSNNFAPTNSLLQTHPLAHLAWTPDALDTRSQVPCRFSTLDAFIRDAGFDRIDLLKLDVQGAERKVLAGGSKALAAGLIDVIFMEIIITPTYQGQSDIAEYLELLHEYGMGLYGFYNLSHISGRLRQLDALFVRN